MRNSHATMGEHQTRSKLPTSLWMAMVILTGPGIPLNAPPPPPLPACGGCLSHTTTPHLPLLHTCPLHYEDWQYYQSTGRAQVKVLQSLIVRCVCSSSHPASAEPGFARCQCLLSRLPEPGFVSTSLWLQMTFLDNDWSTRISDLLSFGPCQGHALQPASFPTIVCGQLVELGTILFCIACVSTMLASSLERHQLMHSHADRHTCTYTPPPSPLSPDARP